VPQNLRRKHRRTLNALFRRPRPTDLKWNDFVALIEALGGTVENQPGSARAVLLNDKVGVFHQPHTPEMGKGMVKRIEQFLRTAGVSPE
jgi:hypothetical protein